MPLILSWSNTALSVGTEAAPCGGLGCCAQQETQQTTKKQSCKHPGGYTISVCIFFEQCPWPAVRNGCRFYVEHECTFQDARVWVLWAVYVNTHYDSKSVLLHTNQVQTQPSLPKLWAIDHWHTRPVPLPIDAHSAWVWSQWWLEHTPANTWPLMSVQHTHISVQSLPISNYSVHWLRGVISKQKWISHSVNLVALTVTLTVLNLTFRVSVCPGMGANIEY